MTTDGIDATTALQRTRELHSMMGDPTARFSLSATRATLEEIETGLLPGPGEAEARAQIALARGLLFAHASDHGASLAAYQQALAFHATQPFIDQRTLLKVKVSVAMSYGHSGNLPAAIEAMTDVRPQLKASGDYDPDGLAGWDEQLAYWLHEVGHYDQAQAINLEVLATAEQLFGPDGEQLMVVLTNLGQNYYSLGQPDQARPYLERALAIATQCGDVMFEHKTIFELGVLAYEQGRIADAQAYFERGVERAKTTNSESLVQLTQQRLDEFIARRDSD